MHGARGDDTYQNGAGQRADGRPPVESYVAAACSETDEIARADGYYSACRHHPKQPFRNVEYHRESHCRHCRGDGILYVVVMRRHREVAHEVVDADAKIEMNNVSLLFKVIRESNYVTILSESTVIDQRELVAVPLDVPGNDMEGCIHVLKNSYIKASAREFIRMLSSSSVMRNFGFNALHE